MPSPQINQHQKTTEENRTEVMEFVLLGFSDIYHLQWFLFGLFLAIYIIILLGHGTI
jgi:olfactory receptor